MSRTPNRNYPYPDPGHPYLLTTDFAEFAKAVDTDVNGVSGAVTPSVAINDLMDVDTATSPAIDGQALVYSTSDGVWKPGTMSVTQSGATNLDGLSDVDTSTTAPTDGTVLSYDGTAAQWVPAAIPPGVTSLDGLSDVDTTTTAPTEGQVLVYKSGAWKPGAAGGGGSTSSLPELWANNGSSIAISRSVAGWGTRVVPKQDSTLTQVRIDVDAAAADSFRAYLLKLNGSTVVEKLAEVAVPGPGVASTKVRLSADVDWPITAGNNYGVFFARVGGSLTSYYDTTKPRASNEAFTLDEGLDPHTWPDATTPPNGGTIPLSTYPLNMGITATVGSGAVTLGEKVVALGTSIADGEGATSVANAYPARIAAHAGAALGKTVTVVEAGVSGDTSAMMLSRLPALLDEHAPAYVTIEASVNDSYGGNPVPLEETAANVREMVALCRLARATPVVLTAGWVDPTRGNGWDQAAVDEIPIRNAMVRAAGSELGVSVVDIWEALPHDNTVLADKLHPNDTGHDLYGQEVAAALTQQKWGANAVNSVVSPNGTAYELTVSDAGALSVTAF